MVRHRNELYLHSTDKRRTEPFDTGFLSENVVGFEPGRKTIIRVAYWNPRSLASAVKYHFYQGGPRWVPTVPGDIAKRGDIVIVSPEILSRDQFVADLPTIELYNYLQTDWGANAVFLTDVRLTGDNVHIQAKQEPRYSGVSDFSIHGKAISQLSFNRGITSLDVLLTDVYGKARPIRINYDGHTQPWLGVWDTDSFSTVHFLSFDDCRLRFTTLASANNIDVATLYAKLPNPSLFFGQYDRERTAVCRPVFSRSLPN